MSQHPSELTLALDGEVTPEALAKAAAAFARLLDAISQEGASGAPLEWIISDLRSGSSVLTAECRATDPADAARVRTVIARGHRFGEEMEHGNGSTKKTPALREIEASFRSLARGRLVRVRLESPERDYILAGFPRSEAAPGPLKTIAVGSVRGRVQAMNSHGSMRFTLYDVNDDKGVSCYLPEGSDSEQEMLGLWGKLVEVEGRITRDADGRPLSIRDIAGISAIEDPSWRQAIGAAPGFLGNESAEDIIRRARDE